MCCGSLEYYDKSYDRINVKNERPLQRIDRVFHTVSASDDPIMRKVRTHPLLILVVCKFAVTNYCDINMCLFMFSSRKR